MLLSPEVRLCDLDAGMTKEQLDLFKITALSAAQIGAGAPQVVRADGNADRFSLLDNNIKNRLRANSSAGDGATTLDGPKQSPFRDPRRLKPCVDRGFDPGWHWHCSDAAVFAFYIEKDPAAFPTLQMACFE
jgi:hypothetical protein